MLLNIKEIIRVLDLGRERVEAWGTVDAKMAGGNGNRRARLTRESGLWWPFVGEQRGREDGLGCGKIGCKLPEGGLGRGRVTARHWRTASACRAGEGRGRVVAVQGSREGRFWGKPWARRLFWPGRGQVARQVSSAPAYGAAVGRA